MPRDAVGAQETSAAWYGEWKRFRGAQGSPSAEREVEHAGETAADWHLGALKPDEPAGGLRSGETSSDAPPEDARTDEAAWLWAVTDEPDEGALWNEKTKAPTKTCENEKTALRHDEASASH